MINTISGYSNFWQTVATRATRIEGELSALEGGSYEFDDSVVIRESFEYSNESSKSGVFSVGTAQSGKLKITLYDDDLPRRWMNEAYTISVRMYYDIMDGNHTEQEFDFGTWTVDSITKGKKTLTFECYDNMNKFDKTLQVAAEGSIFGGLSFLCGLAGVELGNTQAEIESLMNGLEPIRLLPEDLGTLREGLCQIGLLTCSFATIGLDGKLYMRSYHMTPDITIRPNRTIRGAEHMSQDVTHFNGLSMSVMSDDIIKTYSQKELIIGAEDMIFDYGEILILNRHFGGYTDNIWRNIYSYFTHRIDGLSYYSSDFEIVPNAALELGDTIEYIDMDGTSKISIVNRIVHRFKKPSTIISNGQTAASNKARSATTRERERQAQEIEKAAMVVLTYTNLDDLDLSTNYEKVTEFQFVCKETTKVLANITLPIVASADGQIDVQYKINGLEDRVFTDSFVRGDNITTIDNYYTFEKGDIVNFQINAKVKYFETDDRRQNAKITSILNYIDSGTWADPVIDQTVPAVSIGAEMIRSFIWAKGITSETEWDGILILADEIEPIGTGTEFETLTDSATVAILDVLRSNLSDTWTAAGSEATLDTLTDSVRLTMNRPIFDLTTEDDFNIVDETGVWNIATE